MLYALTFLFCLFGWLLLYKLFKTRSKITIALIISIITLILLPATYQYSQYAYNETDKLLFQRHADGFVQLAHSPMRIPLGAPKNYCAQFTDQKGKPISTISADLDNNLYCGYFW